jgi:NADH:ubiquinone oxidoreductase subunit 3 (subunit A)
MDYFFLLLYIGLAAAFILGGLGVSRLLSPHRPGGIKNTPYECGEQPIGQAWIQFNVGYYLIGLLFLAFEVEAAFLYPWAVAFREMGVAGLVEVVIFLLVLIMGLVYAWKKGALEWV